MNQIANGYKIKYADAFGASERLEKIRLTFGKSSDMLLGLSRQTQTGLEKELEMMGRWARTLEQYSDEMKRAGVNLAVITETYKEAEGFTFEILSNPNHAGTPDRVAPEPIPTEPIPPIPHPTEPHPPEPIPPRPLPTEPQPPEPIPPRPHPPEPRPPVIPNPGNDFPDWRDDWIPGTFPPGHQNPNDTPLIPWDNRTPAEPRNWEDFPGPIDWRNIAALGLIPAIVTALPHIGNRDLISGLLNRNPGGNATNERESATGEGGVGNASTRTGDGMISDSEGSFADAMAGVTAATGRGIHANDALRSELAGQSFGQAGTVGGALAAAAGGLNTFTRSGTLDDSHARNGVLDANATGERNAYDSDEIGEHERDIYNVTGLHTAGLSGIGESDGNGIRLAAPLIGAGLGASMGAAGLGAGNSLINRMNRDKGNSLNESAKPPTVEALQSRGFFAGDLRGEYVLLALSIPMLFAGKSIAASLKKSKETNDRFRIGYGVSAVVSGDPIKGECA